MDLEIVINYEENQPAITNDLCELFDEFEE